MLLNIHELKYIFWLVLCAYFATAQQANAQEQKTFSSLNEVLSYAKEKNYTFRNAAVQTKLAELTKKSALGNVFNPRIPASIQSLDNIKLQKIYIQGDLAGQTGPLRPVATGQTYSSLFNIQPQFEILNLSGINQVKSAKINQQLTEVQNKIDEQTIYDQINSIYFNILSYQGQIEIVKQNIAIADTILRITQNRFVENVGRKQDVNEAEVNLINQQYNLEQLLLNLKIQEESLSLFFENSIYPILAENIEAYEYNNDSLQTNNELQTQKAKLQLAMMEQDIKVSKGQNWPMLSFVTSFNWQNLGNDSFFGPQSNWIDYSYVGLKLSMDLPTTVSKLSSVKDKQFQSMMLKTNADHSTKETETKNRQMVLDYEKAVSQLQNFKKIALLKEDTYNKNFNQYRENILALDRLLISHNDLMLAKLNVVTALANLGFNKSKIDINNKF